MKKNSILARSSSEFNHINVRTNLHSLVNVTPSPKKIKFAIDHNEATDDKYQDLLST